MEKTRVEAPRAGCVETVFGRRLVPARHPRPARRGAGQGAERAAINAPMQGTAADLIKKAMIAVAGWLKGSEKLDSN